MQSSVKIVLNDNASAFYASQTVTGRVECTFSSEKTIKAIRLKFQGIAKTKWTVNRRKRRTSFWAEEIYFNEEYTLVETHGGDYLHLSAGMHAYPFSYTLPQTLPTSFDDLYGKTKYKIKVSVDRPRKTNFKDKLHLHIVPSLDLNTILEDIREPFSHSVEGNASCLCFKSDSITFAIFLPFTGYAASQEINVGSYIQNMTNVNVERVQYEVIRTLQFIADHPYTSRRFSENTIASCTAGVVGAHAEKSWTSTLVVPLDFVLNFLHCGIMDVTYRLKVKVIMPFPHPDLKISCPLMFGTVPLLGLDTNMPGPPTQPDPMPTAPPVEEPTAGSSHAVGNGDQPRSVHGSVKFTKPGTVS